MQKKSLILPFSAAFLFLAIFWGCSKSSSSSSTPSNSVSLITQASWKYDTSGIDLDEDGKIDNNDIADTVLKPCEKDDTFTFDKDSTGDIDEGPTKCHVGDAQDDDLAWEFLNNDKILNVVSTTVLNGSLNVLNLTATNMVLYKDTSYLGLSFRYLIALKH
jgi:hypothetical protein